MKSKVKKSLLWQSYNVAGLAIIQLVYYGILARILSTDDFGVVALANSFINFSSLFTQIGLGPALIQHKNPSRRHVSTSLFTNTFIGLFFLFLIVIIREPISVFFESDILKEILPILSLVFVISALGNSSMSLLQREMNFKYLFFAENIAHLVGMSFGIILAFLGLGVWSIIYATILYQVIQTILMIWKVKVSFLHGWSYSDFKELFHFGAGLTLIRVNNYMTNSGVNLLLGKFLSLSALGIFERSYRIMMIPGKMLGDVIDKVMFPAMSRKQDQNEALVSMYSRNISMSLFLTLPLSIWLWANTEFIIWILLGDKWLEAIPVLQIMFLAIPFRVTIRLTDSLVRAKGLVYQSALRKLLFTIVLFSSIWVGSSGGLVVIAYIILGTSIFQYFNMSGLVVRRLKMTWIDQIVPFLRLCPMLILFSLGVLGVDYFFHFEGYMQGITLLISLIIGFLVVYLVLLFYPSFLGNTAVEILSLPIKVIRNRRGSHRNE